MVKMMARDLHVIVGLGATGFSVAAFLAKQGIPFAMMDTRANPPQLEAFKALYPDALLSLGKWDTTLLNRAAQIILSPGIALREPAIAAQIQQGVSVVGDIELFAKSTQQPIIAITGTNAKSTVTTLVGDMAKRAGIKVEVGGNLGTPALDLLSNQDAQLFVLELSSFQLETTFSLKAAVATVLNITPDHMDRYDTLEAYRIAKHRIYSDCQVAVCNRDDLLTDCADHYERAKFYFTLNEPKKNEFGLIKKNNELWLAFENQALMPVRELPVLGRHYQANALAALAIGHGFGLSFEPMLETLRTFQGLPHRCQLVRSTKGVSWYNDSKGTNVGASLAAIEGLGSEISGKLILIAGGIGKNADFSSLVPALQKYVRTVILIGEAAPILAEVIGQAVEVRFASGMEEAVVIADQIAEANDSVLLSPACASFDMFKNFEHRGDVFSKLVMEL